MPKHCMQVGDVWLRTSIHYFFRVVRKNCNKIYFLAVDEKGNTQNHNGAGWSSREGVLQEEIDRDNWWELISRKTVQTRLKELKEYE